LGNRFAEGDDLVHILDARRAFHARRNVDQGRAGYADGFGDIVCGQAEAEDLAVREKGMTKEISSAQV